MSDQRLQNLEAVVRAMRDEMRQIRAEVARLGGGAVPPLPGADNPLIAEGRSTAPEELSPVGNASRGSPPNSKVIAGGAHARHRSAAPPMLGLHRRNTEWELEALVGRYATMAVAVVLVVMGIGAFVTWAATRVVIGPGARVALGALAAALLAVIGQRLAARGSVAFGGTILALALAVLHVDAWAAGPVLGLVPNVVAMGVAALASAALAVLAVREHREMLFAVGVGGALLAPFVTGDRDSSLLLFLTYGWVVVASALAVGRPREWRLSSNLVLAGAVLYSLAGAGVAGAVVSDRVAVAVFAIGCAWAAFLWGGERERAGLALGYVALGMGTLLLLVTIGRAPLPLVIAAVIGTASSYVILESGKVSRAAGTAGAFVIPLGYLVGALATVAWSSPRGALLAAGWSVGAFVVARVSRDHRDWHLAAGSVSALLAIGIGLRDQPVACGIALSFASVVVVYFSRRNNAPSMLVPALLALALCLEWSQLRLMERPAFRYPPFATPESLMSAAVAAASFAAWRLIRGGERVAVVVAAILGGCALFFWGRAELAGAVRPEVATFLLILYYALFGIAAIVLGRMRDVSELRKVGLVLALYAAVKAVAQASSLTTIGFRVGSYLLVGGFLLAVAYWYRAAGPIPDERLQT